jgi:hypothetical protein
MLYHQPSLPSHHPSSFPFKITGSIEVLGFLQDLAEIRLQQTSVTGDVGCFDELSALTAVDISRTKLEGDIKVNSAKNACDSSNVTHLCEFSAPFSRSSRWPQASRTSPASTRKSTATPSAASKGRSKTATSRSPFKFWFVLVYCLLFGFVPQFAAGKKSGKGRTEKREER